MPMIDFRDDLPPLGPDWIANSSTGNTLSVKGLNQFLINLDPVPPANAVRVDSTNKEQTAHLQAGLFRSMQRPHILSPDFSRPEDG